MTNRGLVAESAARPAILRGTWAVLMSVALTVSLTMPATVHAQEVPGTTVSPPYDELTGNRHRCVPGACASSRQSLALILISHTLLGDMNEEGTR